MAKTETMTPQPSTDSQPADDTGQIVDRGTAEQPARRWKMRLSVAAASVLLIVAGSVYLLNGAQTKPPLGRQWPVGEQISMDAVDHSVYDALLRKYVDTDGYVNYTSWKGSATDRQALLNYLNSLSQAATNKRASRAGRIAFWINAYNAVTIEGILQEYPTDSIRDHTSRFGGYNIWKDLPLLVGNRPYSLEEIEHQILRKMKEPRIHFSIVCASVGCPRLLSRAYTGKTLEGQLVANARDFFSRRQNLQVERDSGTIRVSSILKWFGEDFGHSQTERFTYLKPYLPEEARSIAVDPQTKVRYLDYDWNLNDQRSKPRSASKH